MISSGFCTINQLSILITMKKYFSEVIKLMNWLFIKLIYWSLMSCGQEIKSFNWLSKSVNQVLKQIYWVFLPYHKAGWVCCILQVFYMGLLMYTPSTALEAGRWPISRNQWRALRPIFWDWLLVLCYVSPISLQATPPHPSRWCIIKHEYPDSGYFCSEHPTGFNFLNAHLQFSKHLSCYPWALHTVTRVIVHFVKHNLVWPVKIKYKQNIQSVI